MRIENQGFEIINNRLHGVHDYNFEDGIVVIPDGFKIIESCAFIANDSIKKVIVPNGVETIGSSAFSCCHSLREIVLPNTIKEIKDSAFIECVSLESIDLPNSVQTIENCAFQGCTSLKEISFPEGIGKIGSRVCSDCLNLKNVNIPNSFMEISACAFENCIGLKNIVIPQNVKNIRFGAFKNCKNLEDITLGDNVQIDYGAFLGCNLPVDENGFTIINNILFRYNGDGKNVIIPEGVTRIDNQCFKQKKLFSIKLPNTIKEIGAAAFCESEIKESINIPDTVTNIGEACFSDCSFPENCTLTIPESVTRLNFDTFVLARIKEIRIPGKTFIDLGALETDETEKLVLGDEVRIERSALKYFSSNLKYLKIAATNSSKMDWPEKLIAARTFLNNREDYSEKGVQKWIALLQKKYEDFKERFSNEEDFDSIKKLEEIVFNN